MLIVPTRNHPDPTYGSSANPPTGADRNLLVVRPTSDTLASRGIWQYENGAYTRVESPQYDRDLGQAGLYLNPAHSMGTDVNSFTPGRVYLARFHASRAYTFQHVAFAIGAVATVDTGLDVGIYSVGATTLTLLGNYGGAAANQLASANSVKTLALSANLTIQPGVYYAAWQTLTATGSPTVGRWVTGGNFSPSLAGTGIGVQELAFVAAAATTLPATITWSGVTTTINIVPAMFGLES